MKKLQALTLLAIMTVSTNAYEGIKKLSLANKPKLYSKLYQQLSEEDRITLFEMQKKNLDQGGLPFDPTVACSRWITIGTVIRASTTANLGGGFPLEGTVIHMGEDDYGVGELYFDIEDKSVFEGVKLN